MIPAHERLGAGDLAGLEVELGLVVDDDLAGLDRVGQLADQREAGARVAVARGAVDLVADAAGLGRVHGDVGALHQRLDVAAVLGEHRDADAGAHEQRQALEAERLLDRAGEAAGDLLGLLDGGAGREQDGELVAADAGHELGVGHAGLQPRADLAQEPVAGLVAERVVELLEVVEVDQQQRELGLVGAGGGGRVLEAGEQAAAVGEPGQRVVHRVVLALGGERAQLGLELAAIGRVAHVEHVAVDAGVVQAVGGDDVEVAVPALAVREAQRQVAGVVGVAGGLGEVAVERGAVVRVDELVDAACRRARRGPGRARRGSRRPASGRAGPRPTIVTTSVEFWTIEVRRRWMISEARSATDSDWPSDRRQGRAHGAREVAVHLRRAPAGVGDEQRGHPEPVAGEREERAAVEAAEARGRGPAAAGCPG